MTGVSRKFVLHPFVFGVGGNSPFDGCSSIMCQGAPEHEAVHSVLLSCRSLAHSIRRITVSAPENLTDLYTGKSRRPHAWTDIVRHTPCFGWHANEILVGAAIAVEIK